MKTIKGKKINEKELLDTYNYQIELTQKLDNKKGDFNKETFYEIILWKLNRFADIDNKLLSKINSLSKDSRLNETKTREILNSLLEINGIRLPMASTILRFRNPNIYQILDQRVFRVIFGKDYKHSAKIERTVDTYFEYLAKLKNVCDEHKLSFKMVDRTLYELDKKINPRLKIKY